MKTQTQGSLQMLGLRWTLFIALAVLVAIFLMILSAVSKDSDPWIGLLFLGR